MFNLEIKRVSVKSVVLSAYPFVVFIFTLLSAFFNLGSLVEPEAGIFTIATQVVLYSLITTAVIVCFSVLACFIYNMLCNFGMKGFRISLEEVEDNSAQTQEQEEAPAPAQEVPAQAEGENK